MSEQYDGTNSSNRLQVLIQKSQHAAQELGYLDMIGADLEEYEYVIYRNELVTPSDKRGFVSKEEVDEFKRLSAEW